MGDDTVLVRKKRLGPRLHPIPPSTWETMEKHHSFPRPLLLYLEQSYNTPFIVWLKMGRVDIKRPLKRFKLLYNF